MILPQNIDAVNYYGALGRLDQPVDHLHCCRLAAAGRACQHDDLSLGNFQMEPFDDNSFPVLLTDLMKFHGIPHGYPLPLLANVKQKSPNTAGSETLLCLGQSKLYHTNFDPSDADEVS